MIRQHYRFWCCLPPPGMIAEKEIRAP